MRILVLVSGVEMWNVTPSKSDTTWSTDTGGALSERVSYGLVEDGGVGEEEVLP